MDPSYLNNPDRTLGVNLRKVLEYLQAVQAAGGFPAYARAHRSIFVAIFSRGTLLPTAVLLTIVEYWAHLGWYQYHVPGTALWARTLSLRSRSQALRARGRVI